MVVNKVLDLHDGGHELLQEAGQPEEGGETRIDIHIHIYIYIYVYIHTYIL